MKTSVSGCDCCHQPTFGQLFVCSVFFSDNFQSCFKLVDLSVACQCRLSAHLLFFCMGLLVSFPFFFLLIFIIDYIRHWQIINMLRVFPLLVYFFSLRTYKSVLLWIVDDPTNTHKRFVSELALDNNDDDDGDSDGDGDIRISLPTFSLIHSLIFYVCLLLARLVLFSLFLFCSVYLCTIHSYIPKYRYADLPIARRRIGTHTHNLYQCIYRHAHSDTCACLYNVRTVLHIRSRAIQWSRRIDAYTNILYRHTHTLIHRRKQVPTNVIIQV